MLYRLLKINPANPTDRSAFYLVVEIFWMAFIGAALSFAAPYAIRLGATNTQIGLLTSLPALAAILVSIPAGNFLQTHPHRKPWLLGSLLIARMSYLLLVFVPWLDFLGIEPGLLVVVILVLFSPVGSFFNLGFTALLADIIPENRRAAVFSARSIIYSATVSACVFLFGQWLDRAPFPANYQIMFLVGFITSIISLYFLLKLDVPESPVMPAAETPAAAPPGWRAFIGSLKQHPAFLRMTLNTLLHAVALWTISPLYILYYVRELNASNSWIGLNTTLANMATIAGYALWRWIIERWGEMRTLKITILFAGVIPILVGLAGNLNIILAIVVVAGLVNPGISLSHITTLYKSMPSNERNRFMSVYMTFTNTGVFIFPMLGVWLADHFPYRWLLVVFGVLAIIGSASFIYHPVHLPTPAVPPTPPTGDGEA